MRRVCRFENPSERAAARWLGWTESMPARKVSAVYADDVRIQATVPQKTGSLGTPLQSQGRHAEPEHEDDENGRSAAEEVGIDDGKRSQRKEAPGCGLPG